MTDEKKNKVTSASLAENSVVIAFRDWQWQNHKAHLFDSSSFVSLAGKAETKLGDGILGIDDRLLILEVKSIRENIISEWKEDKVGEPKKNAFRVLRECLTNFGEEPEVTESSPALNFLFNSVAGHFFLYWMPSSEEGSAHGELVVEPYLLAINKDNGFQPKEVSKPPSGTVKATPTIPEKRLLTGIKKMGDRFKIGISEQHTPYKKELSYRTTQVLDLEAMYDGSAIVIETPENSDSGQHFWSPIGIPLDEFKGYVDHLCGNAHHQINVILTSLKGTIFAHITNTNDLLLFSEYLSIRACENEVTDGSLFALYSNRYPFEELNKSNYGF